MKTLTPALSNAEPLPRAIIIEDPYEVYLRTAPEDHGSDCLTVAKESSALRTILPLVNHNQYVESVLDPGSQVIAMSEAACHALALIYDPRIRLRMQSANREVDETLGLAQNASSETSRYTSSSISFGTRLTTYSWADLSTYCARVSSGTTATRIRR